MLQIPPARQSSESQRLARASTAAFQSADRVTDPVDKADALERAQDAAELSALAAAYTYLQRAVGLIALALPFLLVGLNYFFFQHDVKGSISEYYYTPVGSVFVGSMCALAVFFLSYNHRPLPHYELDNIVSNVACIAALGVAFFPTARSASHATSGERVVAVVHLVSAAILFVSLAYFSLFLFRKRQGSDTGPRKRWRNRIYTACGVVIVVAVVGVPVANALSWPVLLPLEWVAVFAFSVSWLVKGGLLPFLNDPPMAQSPAPPAIGLAPRG
jgi:hypothetical protein